jgi:DtxR family transcriptional regulator, Mn-dependent transcriptional regulator
MTRTSERSSTFEPVNTLDTTRQRRQMLVERLLVDVLRYDWASVHVEAEQLATAVSPEVEARIVAVLNDPGTCPHGNPIPGSRNAPDQSAAVPLMDAEGLVEVVRIDDAVEEEPATMKFLEACGLIPGRWAEVTWAGSSGVHVVGARAHAVIPARTAQHTWVRPVDPRCD